MNEKLDVTTDTLIGKVSEMLKRMVEKVINEMGAERETVIDTISDMIGVSSEDITAVIEDDIALLDFATVARMCIAFGCALVPTDVNKGDDRRNFRETTHRSNEHPNFPPPPRIEDLDEDMRPHGLNFPPPPPPFLHFGGERHPRFVGNEGRPSRGFFDIPRQERAEMNARPNPNFRAMSREKLVSIIKNHLWDTEIDTSSATVESLARFLEAKDAIIRHMRGGQAPTNPNGCNVGMRNQFMPHPNPIQNRQERNDDAAQRRERLKQDLFEKGRKIFSRFVEED